MNAWPKQLEIRNTYNGIIWQIYHVMNQTEIDILTKNAMANGFGSVTWQSELSHTETFPDWRDTPEWKKCLENYK